MRRLRDPGGADDPAMTELAEMIRSVEEPEPRPGAEERVLRAMSRRKAPRSWWWLHAVVVLFMVVVVRIEAFIASDDGDGPSVTTPETEGLARPGASRVEYGRQALEYGPQALEYGPQVLESAPPALPVPPSPPSQGEAERARSVPNPQLDRRRVQREVPRAAPEVTRMPDPPEPSKETPVEPPPPPPQQLATDAHAAASPGPARTPVDEPALVYEAIRALRRNDDPRTAIQKLQTYRQRYPSGAFAEQALALLIEALIATSDDDLVAASRVLAREYLQRFPQGRSRRLAEQAERQTFPSDLVALYRLADFQGVVRACSDATVTETNATVCTLSACEVGDSAKAERWLQLSSPAARDNISRGCSEIAQDKRRIAQDKQR
jgi:hypothetical protein